MKLLDTDVLLVAINASAPQHAGSAGNLTHGAHLAAVALEHGATLLSFDNDFAGFAGLSFERLSERC